MKNISLLPPEIGAREKKKENQRYYYYSLAGFILLLLLLFFSLVTVTLSNRYRADSVMEQRLAIEQQIEELKIYEDMQIKVNEAEEILRSALGNSPFWYDIIRELSLSFTADILLADVSATFENEPGELLVRGHAQSYDSVAIWLEKIENIAGLKEVRLRNTYEEISVMGSVIAFETIISIEAGNPFALLREGGE